MRRIIKPALSCFIAVILLTFGTASASAQYYMNVLQKDGVEDHFLLSDIDSIYFSVQDNPTANYEYVDLGLSVKWATFNVGATKPEEYGDYFAWGETEPKTDNTWSSYKWCNGSRNTITKYCSKSDNGYEGYTDELTVLTLLDDVANVIWGDNWRMPTMADWDELCNNCTWTWYKSGNTEFNGVAGIKVTSNIEDYTERFIFLPAAGAHNDGGHSNVGSHGNYWSSTLDTKYPYGAYGLYFDCDTNFMEGYLRYSCRSIRPVCP